jgi:hypothetical protein
MHKIFHGKSVTITKIQHVFEIQTIIINVNVVDVNVMIRNKATEKHVSRIENQGKQKMLLTRRENG